MSLAQYADPIEGMFAEMQLGRRGEVRTVVPDGDECEHIAALLRKGLTRGIGVVRWDLRTAPGVKFPQNVLDSIAKAVEEAQLQGTDPCWRISVLR